MRSAGGNIFYINHGKLSNRLLTDLFFKNKKNAKIIFKNFFDFFFRKLTEFQPNFFSNIKKLPKLFRKFFSNIFFRNNFFSTNFFLVNIFDIEFFLAKIFFSQKYFCEDFFLQYFRDFLLYLMFAKFFIRNFAYCEFFCFAILVYRKKYCKFFLRFFFSAMNDNTKFENVSFLKKSKISLIVLLDFVFFMLNYFRFFLFFDFFNSILRHQKVQRSEINSFWIFFQRKIIYMSLFFQTLFPETHKICN